MRGERKQRLKQKLVPLKTFLVRTLFKSTMQRWTTNLFQRMYVAYPEQALFETYWMGVRTIKCPQDLWIFQEIIFSLQPDVIVETGTFDGGSALYMAHLCDLLGNGRVLTIDIEAGERCPQHPRIQYIQGDSTSTTTLDQVCRCIDPQETVLITLDSDHSQEHVRQELELYSPLVTPGSYLIVEDTQLNGHPVRPEFGPGPMEAVDEFLMGTSRFVIDPSREKFFMSFNYNGYLRCVK